jgi:hypothetical protein
VDVVPSPQTIAERRFVVDATQLRVWELLAMVTYQQLPFEKVDIVSLNTFRAVLPWGIASIRLPFCVEGKLIDTSRPNSYGCIIFVKKGPVRLGVKVTMALRGIDASKTEVYCTAVQEGKRTILGFALRPLQRRFAQKMFDSIRARLQRLCS